MDIIHQKSILPVVRQGFIQFVVSKIKYWDQNVFSLKTFHFNLWEFESKLHDFGKRLFLKTI